MTPQEALIQIFQPDGVDFQTVRDDLRLAIVLNPTLENIEQAMELYASAKLTKAIGALEDCINSLEYAAYNIDGKKIEDLPAGLIESTGAADTALISARNAKQTLTELKQKP